MIATATATNTHIAALGKVLGPSQTAIDYLVIMHRDPVLQQRLSQALCQESAVLLEVAQDRWQMEDGDLPAAIAWAIETHQIPHLVLVGDSSAALADPSVLRLTREEANGSRSTLLDRVKNVAAARERSEDYFVTQLTQLLENSKVGGRVAAGALQLHGLFYRAESDVFTSYDAASKSFAVLN